MKPRGMDWLANELHVSLEGGAPPLALVAGQARSDNVVPGAAPSTGGRCDVIQGELVARSLAPAILTGLTVPEQDIRAGESDDVSTFLQGNIA